MKEERERELWIGLFEARVTALCRLFGNATFASSNAVALADSEADFMARVRNSLEDIGLLCLRFEDIETYENRIAAFEVHPSVSEAAKRAQESGEVAYGTFHVTDESPDVDFE